MIRQMIHIDEETCIGCGLCVNACHEGAIGMVNGKARLLREDHCDGLGNCLPVCPTGAITIKQREAAPFDANGAKTTAATPEPLACGCPGTHTRAWTPAPSGPESPVPDSRLSQWPVQLRLVPPEAPYFDGAHLLVAADCAAYAHGGFHARFMEGKITVIGCPKLDDADYAEKLTEILQKNHIRSVTVVRMEVPCCRGLVQAVTTALQRCGKMIPWQVVTLATDGNIASFD